MVSYTYDPYGKVLSTTGTLAATLGTYNPLRYRGYAYDTETGLYYLQSRYYDPAIGRFINADSFASTGQGLLGNNMFAYCLNNPITFEDSTGSAARVCLSDNDRLKDSPWTDPISGGGTQSRISTSKPRKILKNIEEILALHALKKQGYAFYNGVLVVVTDNSFGSFSYGIIFLNRSQVNNPSKGVYTLKHEYGHFCHLLDIGIRNYTSKVVVPSLSGAILKHLDLLKVNYFDLPWERIAEEYSNVGRGGYTDWSIYAALLYWIYSNS